MANQAQRRSSQVEPERSVEAGKALVVLLLSEKAT